MLTIEFIEYFLGARHCAFYILIRVHTFLVTCQGNIATARKWPNLASHPG